MTVTSPAPAVAVATSTVKQLLLVTTSDAGGGRSSDLRRLLVSVDDYLSKHDGVEVLMLLLVQRSEGTPEGLPPWVQSSQIPGRLSLSAARNTLLVQARSAGLLVASTIVAFPDDDCWYPAGVLDRFLGHFAASPQLDMAFCRYGSSPVSQAKDTFVSPRFQQVISGASSNTIFVRGDVAARIGGFDERLGVGAQYNGGEDTDYAIRSLIAARSVSFLGEKAIGHRDNDPSFKARYYAGSYIAIAKNWHRTPGGAFVLARKLLVGVWLVVRGRLAGKDFFGAIRAGRGGTNGVA